MGKEEVFPIDTLVRQLIEDLYLKRKAKNIKEIGFVQNLNNYSKKLK